MKSYLWLFIYFIFLDLSYNQCDEGEVFLWDQCYSIQNTTELDLAGESLSGSIPSEIGELFYLSYIILQSNQLSGSIPSEIGNLINLSILYLQNNSLSGLIPSEIGELIHLTELKLYGNQLTGQIPSEIGNLNDLRTLGLFNNQLTGPIPSQIGDLSNLNYLWLYNNLLSGEIPSEIGNLSSLTSMFLNNNNFSGVIPSQLGNLSNLSYLHLEDNELEGQLPISFGNMINLNTLIVKNNQFTGQIACNICSLDVIWNNGYIFNADNNQFCPPYPSCIEDFMLSQDTSGCNPELDIQYDLWGQCYIVEITDTLDFNNSGMVGEIPEAIGGLTNLRAIYLYENQFEGSIPNEISNLSNLKSLYLNDNILSGSIPSLMGLDSLQDIYFQYNQLTGEIPSDIGSLVNLEYLFLFENELSGEIPPGIGDLINLKYLYLNDNDLTGLVPESICDLDIDWSDPLVFNIFNNKLCPPYPSCIESFLGYQDTIGCYQSLNSQVIISEEFNLLDAFPNPFNPTTSIGISIPKKTNVSLFILNYRGRKVKTLLSGIQNTGKKYITWDSSNDFGEKVSSGIYFVVFETEKFKKTNKLVLLK